VRALHAPVNTLNASWAYMTMASVAWTMKAWRALWLPVSAQWADRHREQRRRLLRMEFRTFRHAFIDIPCQIVITARTVRWRVQAWNPSLDGPRRHRAVRGGGRGSCSELCPLQPSGERTSGTFPRSCFVRPGGCLRRG